MAAGFDYHLAKPVNVDALQDLVARSGTPHADSVVVALAD
jgi:hypothetical protein